MDMAIMDTDIRAMVMVTMVMAAMVAMEVMGAMGDMGVMEVMDTAMKVCVIFYGLKLNFNQHF